MNIILHNITFKRSHIFSLLEVLTCISLGLLPFLLTFEKVDVGMNWLQLHKSMSIVIMYGAIFLFLSSFSYSLFTVKWLRLEKDRGRQRLHTGHPQDLLNELPFLNLHFKLSVSHTSTLVLLLLPSCKASEGEFIYLKVVSPHSWWFMNYIPCLQFHGLQFLYSVSLISL